jgi:hypothetical protein
MPINKYQVEDIRISVTLPLISTGIRGAIFQRVPFIAQVAQVGDHYLFKLIVEGVKFSTWEKY